jgi:MoaA/NifB/PqqE/SkfB family radical SAM enzyme
MDERIKEIARRILEWKKNGISRPYECRINPTNNCNLACLPCVSRGRPLYDKSKELSENEYRRIVREAVKMGVKRFDICGGGEPFCRKDTIRIMEEIKKQRTSGTISTNGTLIDEKIARKIVEIEWDEIRFSINGPNSRIDDFLRGVKGSFKKSSNAIKKIVNYKKKFKKSKPSLVLMPVITSKNYNEIINFVKLAVELEINSVVLQPFMSEILEDRSGLSVEYRRKIAENLKLKEEQEAILVENAKIAKECAEKYGINHNFDFLLSSKVTHSTDKIIEEESKRYTHELLSIPCYMPWWDLDISVEGGVAVCPRMSERIDVRGKELFDVWNSKQFASFRKLLSERKIPEICKTCCEITTWDNRKIREQLYSLLFGMQTNE